MCIRDRTLTLDSITAGDADISIGAADSATVTISDDDTAEVTVAASDAAASEPGDDGQFTVSISNPSDTDTVVAYTIGGDAAASGDYTALSGTVTILAGQTSATIDVAVIDDSILEDNELVTLTLDSITAGDADISIGAADSATVTISDDDTAEVTITTSDAAASEPGDDGQFTVSISNPSDTDTVVAYTIGGDAAATGDYTALSGTVTILAGQTSATIDVAVIDDSILEDNESVTLTLDSITTGDADILIGAADSATITISDNDIAILTIAANDATASEPGNDGQFTVSISNASDTDTVVAYAIGGDATSGDDFTPLTGTVTILAGQTSATIDVTVIDDSILEDAENVTVTLESITSGDSDISLGLDSTATVTISDDDAAEVTITANDAAAAEPSDDGQFTVSISNISDTDTVVSYTISGDAAAGDDFAALSGTVTILAGQTFAFIDVDTLDDSLIEASETVTVSLAGITSGDSNVSIGSIDSATVTIADDDAGIVSVFTTSDAAEPTTDGQFTVSLDTNSSTDTVVTYSVGGTAANGVDYSLLSGTVTILAGNSSAVIDVSTLDDLIVEPTETVVITLLSTSNTDISVSSVADTATVSIVDNDTALTSISATDSVASEPGDDGQFTVSIDRVSSTDTTVSYTVTGDALAGTDYVALSGSITIPAGSTSATIDVSVLDDSILENNELVNVTLTGTDNSNIAIELGSESASVTISDDDTAQVSVTANDADAAEPGDDGQFTVAITQASDQDTVVNYAISGTATSGDDYTSLSGSVTILAGQTTALIDVNVVDSTLLEESETVTLTLLGTSDTDVTVDGAANVATVTITDDDSATVSIIANDATSSEPTDAGQFTVTISGVADQDTVVAYSVTGTAASGVDFTALSGTVTIAAGSTSTTIDVAVLDDSILENSETVIVTLGSVSSGDADITIDATADTATVTIADDDTATVSVSATDPAASEPADNGQFTVTLSSESDSDTVITYAVGGTATSGNDFTPLVGTVTVLAGQTSATIDLEVVDDGLLENSETVILTLLGTDDADVTVDLSPGANTASVTITDDDIATISVVANDAAAAEPGDDGQFTISISAASDQDTVVSYSVGGTAVGGDDFASLSGTVTILAGQTSAVVDVSVLDDTLLESSETVVLTLLGSDDVDVTVDTAAGANTASVLIADDDVALVSISASDALAMEPSDDGQFTIEIETASSTDTVVNYSIAGTATSGTDFVSLGGSVTILAGQTTALIDLSVLDDGVLEGSETVVATLTGIATGDADIAVDATANSATITIADDDSATISVVATDPTAAEPGDDGEFTVTISSVSDHDVTVNYNVIGTADAGTDYSVLSGSVVIAAGSTTATINVGAIDDNILENDETVIVTLTGTDDAAVTVDTSPGADTAVVTIADNDTTTVGISASDSAASEPGDDGEFVVTIANASDQDTIVNYVVTGTATSGDDFQPLSGSVTILAGQTTATIDLTVIDNLVIENTETVTLTLSGTDDPDVSIDTGAAAATVDIADNDTAEVSVTASIASASEPNANGQFTVAIDNPADSDTVVSYVVTGTTANGSDFTTLTGNVTIAAGSTTAVVDVSVLDDGVLENDETVILTLTGTDNSAINVSGAAGANTATVIISDDDFATVAITASDPTASEPTDDGELTISISATSDQDTIVTYSVGGTALGGSDYTTLTGTATILAGQTAVTIDVSVIDDGVLEGNESVTVTLLGTNDPSVTIDAAPGADNATVTITDDDMATASISANDSAAAEPTDAGQFTVTLDTTSASDTVLTYVVSGSGVAGSDYVALSGTVTVAAGQTSATIDVNVIDDSILENNETVVVTLTGADNPNVVVSSVAGEDSAIVTIADDDTAQVSVVATDDTAAEPGDDGLFTVSISSPSDSDTVVNYVVAGSAVAGSDYTALAGSVTILAGQVSATIDVSTIDDSVLENDEQVTLTLLGASDPDVTVDASANVATVTITDDDTAVVSVSANDASAVEPGDNGQFLVSITNPSDSDTVVDYTITGTADAGTDFVTLSGSVTILAGQTSAAIDVDVIDDSILENSETVIITLTSTDDADVSVDTAANSATVTIDDDDTALVSVLANDSAASEPSNPGQFTVSIDNSSDADTVVNYVVTGTADSGTDFVALAGSITIAAGQTSATVDVNVLDDSILENNETVILTLVSTDDSDVMIDTGSNSASITIADDDTAEVSISSTNSIASEPGVDGELTVTLSQVSDSDTVVSYTVSGTATAGVDYVSLTGTVTIAAGSTTATIDVSVLDDSILEGAEVVTVTLTGTDDTDVAVGTFNASSVIIFDDDAAEVSIAATTPNASEPATAGQFTVTLSSIADVDTVVAYGVSGDATAGDDFTTLSGSVTILAGNNSALIDLAVIDDTILEDNESVTLTLASITSGDADISIGAADTATVTISDDDTAVVTIAANDASASEPGDDGQFTVSISSPSDTDTVVAYAIGGDATSGDDFTPLTGTVTILAGQTSATIDVTVIDDSILEDAENVTVTLEAITSGDSDISLGLGATATVTISDNDTAEVTIAANDASACLLYTSPSPRDRTRSRMPSSA